MNLRIVACCQMYSRVAIYLSDERHISFNSQAFPALNKAITLNDPLPKFTIAENGQSIEWPELHIQITLEQLLSSTPWSANGTVPNTAGVGDLQETAAR